MYDGSHPRDPAATLRRNRAAIKAHLSAMCREGGAVRVLHIEPSFMDGFNWNGVREVLMLPARSRAIDELRSIASEATSSHTAVIDLGDKWTAATRPRVVLLDRRARSVPLRGPPDHERSTKEALDEIRGAIAGSITREYSLAQECVVCLRSMPSLGLEHFAYELADLARLFKKFSVVPVGFHIRPVPGLEHKNAVVVWWTNWHTDDDDDDDANVNATPEPSVSDDELMQPPDSPDMEFSFPSSQPQDQVFPNQEQME